MSDGQPPHRRPTVHLRRRGDRLLAFRRDVDGRHRVTRVAPWLADLVEETT